MDQKDPESRAHTWTFTITCSLLITSVLVAKHPSRLGILVAAIAHFFLLLSIVAGHLQGLAVVPTGEYAEGKGTHREDVVAEVSCQLTSPEASKSWTVGKHETIVPGEEGLQEDSLREEPPPLYTSVALAVK